MAQRKLEHYCAYQERCHSEVKKKLSDLGFWGDWAEEIIQKLIDDNFLSEERFVGSYCRSKFKYKRWGKLKIVRKLREKRLSKSMIDFGLKEIEEEEYWKTLNYLFEKKSTTLKEEDPRKRKKKILDYLTQKGYESSLIWKVLNERLL